MLRPVHRRLPVFAAFSEWRLAVASGWASRSAGGKVGSPDLHQAKMRCLVLIGCVLYGVSIGVLDEGLSRTPKIVFIVDAFLFGLFALHTHLHFKRNPEPDYLRRALGLFADHGAALGCLAVTGRYAGALAWLPLFIIQGVGIRFGVRWLFASQAIGVASVGVIYAVNPFFRDNATVALGAILSVLVLPLYFALLAKREARIKAALVEARLEAEAANEAKGRFVAMISHELRTPLTGISGLNEILRKQVLPAQTQQMLAEQHAATELMLTMVNDVLDLSKVEDGKMQLQEVEFDPQELAFSVLRGLSFQAKRKGLAVHLELDASLPEVVIGSPFHVSRILQNLVGNAIKFTLQGSITLRVLRGESPPHAGGTPVQFEVADTGIGIPEEALSKIFDRFFQVDAAVTRRFGGTGLGTSLVKEFCELLQGTVQLESKLGEGTRCRVELPFRERPLGTAAAVVDATGLKIAAFADGVWDWPRVQARIQAAGATVEAVGFAQPFVDDGGEKQDVEMATAVLLGRPHLGDVIDMSALQLADPIFILLEEAAHADCLALHNSSSVVIRTHSDAYLERALRLAKLGGPLRHVAPLGPADRAPRQSVEGTALRVLVAEDTTTIQLVMRITLENAGFAVTIASDGAEALTEAMTRGYDAVILDWNMPKIDGIGVLAVLRNDPGPNKLTPVLIATAAPSQQLIDQAVDAGAQAVISKPFDDDALVDAVNSAVACGLNKVPEATAPRWSWKDVTPVQFPIVDVEALEAPGSIFRNVDPSKLIDACKRDVEKNKRLLTQAASTADLVLFRVATHSLVGYAGTFGARKLQQLLTTVPRDDGAFRAQGLCAAAELCDTLDETIRALDEWSRTFACAMH